MKSLFKWKLSKVSSLNYFLRMSNKEKSIHIIEFSGKKTDWDSWSKKFLHGKWQGYKKLLVSTGTKPGVDEIPTEEEY